MASAMLKPQKKWFVFFILLVIAAGFRVALAHWFPNDAPDDGRIYAQIARNTLEQHVYSHETAPPYDPSYIRLPGYPLFLSAVYSIFGHTNNGAVRIAQALIDTGTCALVALLAFYWQPDEKRKQVTAIAALALAAVCPFTTIYAVTILTEVPTNFFVVAMCLAATLAFRNGFTTEDTEGSLKNRNDFKRALFWSTVWSTVASATRHRFGSSYDRVQFVADQNSKGPRSEDDTLKFAEHPERVAAALRPAHAKISRVFFAGAVFSIAFALALMPWTIRNWRVFHLFQPLAPVNAEMPGEFIPHGYLRWVKTWLDDSRYIDVAVWEVGIQPITIDDLPDSAFDSLDERTRVAALLEQYNHPPPEQASEGEEQSQAQASPTPTAQPSAKQTPASPQALASKATPIPGRQSQQNTDDNSNSNAKSDETEDSSDQEDENDNGDEDQPESKPEDHGPVAMTPQLDAAFGRLAAERIARHPLRYYLWIFPLKISIMIFTSTSGFLCSRLWLEFTL
ncbi:MAG: hypothetical protein DMF75_11410 [Acidobacteria bacterium]|nr:MAG: hypothetical protein DMF75_11410 [Acidobacteriota bacterium]